MTHEELRELKEELERMEALEKEQGPHVFTPAEHKYYAVVSKLLNHIADLDDALTWL